VEDKSKVCLLKKSLYGLNQSSMKWYLQFVEFLLKTDFVRSGYGSYVHILKKEEKVISYLLLYVDDIRKFKEKLNGEFEMKDLGTTKTVIGTDIMRNRDKGELFLS
jgi:hypothetical protein